MKKLIWLVGCAPLLLTACEEFDGAASSPSNQFVQQLPEGVLTMAAPYQDLNAVKLDKARNCYVYRYAGPVETTFLPLRTADGRPICVKVAPTPESTPEPAAPAA